MRAKAFSGGLVVVFLLVAEGLIGLKGEARDGGGAWGYSIAGGP